MADVTPGRRAWRWLTRAVGRKGDRVWRLRLLVQSGFAVTCVAAGVQLGRFYRAALAGELPLPTRPPGVEGFLPISGLMGLLDWVHQGTLNRIHPAASVLVLVFLAGALLLRKSFCSWICPVGLLSEGLARLGRRLFGRNLRPWRWLDVPLRSLKYLLLAFFLWAILGMEQAALRAFIDSPYNRVAEIKMGLFFVHLGVVGIVVMTVLVLLSAVVQGAWCRYLCPYGALLGLVARFSPLAVRRQPASCIDCGLCDRVCMARLPVSTSSAIRSVECTGCLDCLAVCPDLDALALTAGRRRVSVPAFAGALLLLFFLGYATARLSGSWQNQIPDREYVERVQRLEEPSYAHPGS